MRFLTAGESHGPGLTVIVDGFPAGVPLKPEDVNTHLARRQVGYGRGGRMKIEKDQARFMSSVRFEKTTGAPITLFIENRDWANWTEILSAEGERTDAAREKSFMRPRPGHADLAGFYKYGLDDLRDALERASARETAARVAAGSVARKLLEALGVEIVSHVTKLGGIAVPPSEYPPTLAALRQRVESNDLRCGGSDETLARIRERITDAIKEGVTLGGEVEVIVTHLPPGLGSYVQWDRKLDGLLAQAVMSIQAVKAVSIGAGETGSEVTGYEFHDEFAVGKQNGDVALTRPTNRAGGLEGGVTNGMPLVIKAVMKPISTMRKALKSVNLESGEEEAAHFERSDVTAVPACGVVAEAMVAFILADALVQKFGEDNFDDIQAALAHYRARLKPIPTESL